LSIRCDLRQASTPELGFSALGLEQAKILRTDPESQLPPLLVDFEDELHTAQSPTTIKPQYQNQSSPSSNTMDGPEKISFNRSARPLRAINILAFIPGISLLLVSALVTPVGALPLIAIAPLALSTILGLVCIAGDDRPMPWTMYADLCLAMFFVSVLVPMYVPLGWLAGYTSHTFHSTL
jgi:hypothetical protein